MGALQVDVADAHDDDLVKGEERLCITLNNNSVGATLRIDFPRQPGQELPYARTVAHYLTSDTAATSLLFALYTSELPRPGQPKPHAGTIAALTGVLAEQGITIRDGLFVGNETFSPYDGEPGTSLALPVSSTQTSAINAKVLYRGSTTQPINRINPPHLPHHPPHLQPRSSPKRPPSNTTWTPSGPGPWGDATWGDCKKNGGNGVA